MIPLSALKPIIMIAWLSVVISRCRENIAEFAIFSTRAASAVSLARTSVSSPAVVSGFSTI